MEYSEDESKRLSNDDDYLKQQLGSLTTRLRREYPEHPKPDCSMEMFTLFLGLSLAARLYGGTNDIDVAASVRLKDLILDTAFRMGIEAAEHRALDVQRQATKDPNSIWAFVNGLNLDASTPDGGNPGGAETWTRRVIKYSQSKYSARSVLYEVAALADEGRFDPTVPEIAKNIGIADMTVQRSLRKLVAMGELQVVSGPSGRGHGNRYNITIGPKGLNNQTADQA